MPTLDERINNRKNKKKRTITFKTLSIIFMINIAIGCIFFTDYNMNKNLNKKSIIDMFYRILFSMKRLRQSNDILENKNKYIINCKIE